MTSDGVVVLLHGMGRSSLSMWRLGRRLEERGFRCQAFDYPSRYKSLAALGADLSARIRKKLGDARPYAITHSMGGVVVRFMPELPWRRLLLLAPPSQGSAVARRLQDNRLFQRVFGPAGQELASLEAPPPQAPFAVVAGTRAVAPHNPISWVTRALEWLPRDRPSDGLVLVEETRLEGMAGFVEVDATHTHIMNHAAIPGLAERFFRSGQLAEQGG